MNRKQSLVILGVLLTIMAIFFGLARLHSQAFKVYGEHPQILSISDESIQAKYLFCEEENCGVISLEDLRQLVVAKGTSYKFTEFSLKEIENAPQSGFIYHHASIPLPKEIWNRSEPQKIHIPAIFYDRSQVYVDSEFIKDFDDLTYSDTTIFHSLDLSHPKANLDLLVKGVFDGSSSGSMSFTKTFIGPAGLLSKYPIAEERVQQGFALLFLAIKVGLLLVFGLLFFVVTKKNLVFFFMLFGFFQVLEPLMIGDWYAEALHIKERILVFFSSQALGFYFLLRFFHDYSGLSWRKKTLVTRMLFVLPMLLSISLVVANYFGLFSFSINQLFKLIGVGNFVSLLLAFAYPVSQKAFSKEKILKRGRVFQSAPILLVAYASFYLVNNLLLERKGTDLRYFVDIGMYIYIALIAISEFVDLRKLLEKRDRELANKNIDSLIGSQASKVAHDLRRPFSAMKNFIDEYSLLDDTEIKERLDLLSKSIYFSEKQINSILKEKQKLNLDLSSVEVKPWLEDVFRQLKFENSTYKFELSLDLPESIRVYLEKDSYQSIFQNIFVNAMEAMSNFNVSQPKITVSHIVTEQGILQILIENNGPHIPKEKLSKIFDLGFTDGKENGTGIGLAASYATVERHGYELKASNTKEGVCFEIPLGILSTKAQEFSQDKEILELVQENIQAAQSSNAGLAKSTFTGKLYLIEDDPLVVMSWKLKWKGEMDRLIIFNRPKEFFQALDTGKLALTPKDFVVTDYHFENEQDTNGIVVSETLREKYQFKNVFLNTGDAGIGKVEGLNILEGKSSLSPSQMDNLIGGGL